MRKIIQFVCGFAVFAAIFFSWIWTLTFVNRVNLYLNRDSYHPDTFVVTGAEYHRGEEGGDVWWLNGTVGQHEERLVPRRHGATMPHDENDLLTLYPKGTKVDVLYNPGATETLIQGESLRVLAASPDFWEKEARLRNRLGLLVLLPAPITLAVYLLVRFWNRRHARSPAQTSAT